MALYHIAYQQRLIIVIMRRVNLRPFRVFQKQGNLAIFCLNVTLGSNLYILMWLASPYA